MVRGAACCGHPSAINQSARPGRPGIPLSKTQNVNAGRTLMAIWPSTPPILGSLLRPVAFPVLNVTYDGAHQESVACGLPPQMPACQDCCKSPLHHRGRPAAPSLRCNQSAGAARHSPHPCTIADKSKRYALSARPNLKNVPVLK